MLQWAPPLSGFTLESIWEVDRTIFILCERSDREGLATRVRRMWLLITRVNRQTGRLAPQLWSLSPNWKLSL